VSGREKDEAEAGRRAPSERQHRVRRTTGEERPSAEAREPRAGEARRRPERLQAEAGEAEGMPRDGDDRPENPRLERLPRFDDRPHEPAVRRPVGAQPGGGLPDRALEEDGASVLERMREGGGRLDQLEPVLRQRERAEEGRAGNERMDRRAVVVDEAGQRQLAGAEAAADLLRRLEHAHAEPGAGERDRGREPVRPRADDVGVRAQETAASAEERASFTISRAITSRWISCVPS
jgi:hypothetical protein